MNNRIRKKVSAVTVAVLFAVTVCGQGTTGKSPITDLDYLAKELPARHIDLFAQKPEDHFLSGIERIKKESETLTGLETALRTQQLIASLGDSHTNLDITSLLDKERILPLQLYWFADGLYILATTKENAGILGCEIVSINGTGIATVADSLKSLTTADNPSLVKKAIPQLLPFVQILEFFGFAPGGHVELECRDPGGNLRTAIVKPTTVDRGNAVSVRPDSTALCDRNQRAYFTENYFGDRGIYYLQYNRCHSRELEELHGDRQKAAELPSFAEFENNVFRTLEAEPVRKIIFDMRYNGGGNSAQGTAFIERLSEYLKKNPGTRLYVVLGRNTFSSAILNAMDFKRLTDAVFVGEATAGKPNHFGEVRTFRLPESGLNVNYSTKYFVRSDENPDTLQPDMVIERTFADFMKGVDPVFDRIGEQ